MSYSASSHSKSVDISFDISLYPPRAEVGMANRVIFGILRTGYRLISTEAKPRLISVDIDRGEAEVNIATDINRGVAEVDII